MERVDLIRLLGAEAEAGGPRDAVVEAAEPGAFMHAFAKSAAAGGTVFLADPAWGARERAQFDALAEKKASGDGRGWLCIPTGGSSGNLRLARHDEETIAAAVAGFCGHFQTGRVNVVGLLPLYHVSGLMAWMRALLTGGEYLPASWKKIENGDRPPLPPGRGDWFLSLVPTQLQRLLGDREAEEWLRGFRAVFVGGGPAWPELVESGARARLPLAFSYGMTETAAMAAVLRPEEFALGMRGSGRPMPHVRFALDAGGRVGIESPALFRGYWPELRPEGTWWTDDNGLFDAQGSLHILGRRDALIITGGEKVDPAEVETALRATGRFADIAVIGVPDPEWGEIVVACHPAGGDGGTGAVFLEGLAPYKRPKRYVAIADWPRTAQGKVSRAALRERVAGDHPA